MAGAALRSGALLLRVLQFILALICLGIFSYFVSILAFAGLRVLPKWQAAISIIAIATAYTLLAICLVLCLAGSKIFGFIAIFFDLLFVAGFVAVAWFTRHGAYQCNGLVQTPIGDGLSDRAAFGISPSKNRPNLGKACRLNKTVFALAIILIFLFLITAILQLLMSRSKKDKTYDRTSSNNYTNKSAKTPFWKRGKRTDTRRPYDKEMDVSRSVPATTGTAVRPSGETGTTLGNNYVRDPKHHDHDRLSSHHDRGLVGNTPHDRTGHHNAAHDPNVLHHETLNSPGVTTTTTTTIGATPNRSRRSTGDNMMRDRHGNVVPVHTAHDGTTDHSLTGIPGHNVILTQNTPYHEYTTDQQNLRRGQNNTLGNNNTILGSNNTRGQTEYDQNANRGLTGYDQDTTRGHHDTLGQNVLPGHNHNNRGVSGYDQDTTRGNTAGIGNNTLGHNSNRGGNDFDYDNSRGNNTLGQNTTTGHNTTLGQIGQNLTSGHNNSRGTDYDRNVDYDRNNTRGQTGITQGLGRRSGEYDQNNTRGQNIIGTSTPRGQTDYDRNNTRDYNDYDRNVDRDQTGYGQSMNSRSGEYNQGVGRRSGDNRRSGDYTGRRSGDYDRREQRGYDQNNTYGYDDSNQMPPNNRTASGRVVRRF